MKKEIDMKSAEVIFDLIRNNSNGILDGNLTMDSGVREIKLVDMIKRNVVYTA